MGWLKVLARHGAKAIMFCRGDRIREHQGHLVSAVEQGHIVGNHSFNHRPAGETNDAEWLQDLLKCEALIDEVYRHASRQRPGKYFRFPYLDRGDSVRLERELEFFDRRGCVAIAHPRVKRLQGHLNALGFCQPFEGVSHCLFEETSSGTCPVDCLATFSTYDWKLTSRHMATHGITLATLTERIRDDVQLLAGPGNQVVIFHDDPDGLVDIGDALMHEMVRCGIKFWN